MYSQFRSPKRAFDRAMEMYGEKFNVIIDGRCMHGVQRGIVTIESRKDSFGRPLKSYARNELGRYADGGITIHMKALKVFENDLEDIQIEWRGQRYFVTDYALVPLMGSNLYALLMAEPIDVEEPDPYLENEQDHGGEAVADQSPDSP